MRVRLAAGIILLTALGAACAPLKSLRPQDRPNGAAFASICGNPNLVGERAEPVVGAQSGCGIAEPVRVMEVAGLRLTQAALIDCATANALDRWVEVGVKPAVGERGGGPDNLRVAAHYACRTRNNRPGARLSEHAKGRAIDIAGIGLKDGSEITVLTGWGSGADGRALRQMWRAACGPFGTVLGPESDRFHRTHFHLDTAQYRSGSFCR
ncbi:MAG: extensin family protein [Pseudomonadota bacterium]